MEALLRDREQPDGCLSKLCPTNLELLALLLLQPGQQRVAALIWLRCGTQRQTCQNALTKIDKQVKLLPKQPTGVSKAAQLLRRLSRAHYFVSEVEFFT